MHNNTIQKSVRIALIGIIVVSLGLLGWWYFFLKSETRSQRIIDTARGLDISAPEFTSSGGSTYLNLVHSIPSVPLWRSVQDATKKAVQPFVFFREEENETSRPRLWHASALPTAGMAFTTAGGTTTLRFVERATGNVLEAHVGTRAVSRLTNTLVPWVKEALFAGERVFLRGIEDGTLITKTGVVISSSSAKSLVSNELEERILSLAISPSGDTISYLAPDGNGGVALMLASANGGNKKRIATFGTRDWTVYYANKDRIIVATRPADNVVGHAYDATTPNKIVPVVRNIPGLTIAIHASSSAILYGASEKGKLSLYVQKSSVDEPALLPLSTIAEKCAFAPSGSVAYCAVPHGNTDSEFLNRWYRGETHTSDVWWEINVELGTAKQLFDPGIEEGFLIDAEVPVVSDDGAYLAFRNAQDWSLWVLSLR
ncbi:hypothetical protein A2673_02885 [Candidatus Kaiserbacteria bacterium RIFCSPHIGHO2_01_FULL_50_13]|uniref:WD40 repeat domain-containing protein n=1 Tax=Candidatus Kaiserbacteria bacterium RIFCSPLOWO2_01_FULL_50_24 TaxID=1798507 RepID=A0A1F6ERD0_9BACT|nr:MAG: hypothetical protein A2673_02885 [Candidatus Kaiserbacteria bacterium RIFCSPHIGHO2_01_FULL_50_13]OGG76169.1 MAG: hypothetical protein A3A34_01620 [Candidatus Kaiserbacteria bacterium RIFCSPLOWO2_01_FULL_50_24]OGG81154.1 MAG: hypothetical protein A3H74_01720 [Candidatus Kaiserbacteria bacterium RIFCSPLOWO2_02_FULL_51_13]